MDRRLLVPTLILALASTALAGCIEMPGAETEATEVTALEYRDLADEAALAWAQGARLVSIFGLELAHDAEPLPVDENPGNGLAPAWIYAYASPEGEAAAFRVLADGTVVAENETYGAEAYKDAAEPLGIIAVDSDAGLASAAKDESFAKALSGAGVVLAQGVAHWEGATSWYYAAMSEQGSAYAIVDASTGELVSVKPFDVGPKLVAAKAAAAYRPSDPIRMEEKGTLSSAQRSVEIPFEHAGLDGAGMLHLAIRKSLATDGVAWEILGADEEPVASGFVGRSLSPTSDARAFEFELEEPGAYTLVLTLRQPMPVGAGAVDYALKLAVGDLESEEEEEH